MLRRRRVFAVEPLWSPDGARKPWESCVVLTSASIYRKLQEASGESTDPAPEPQRGSRMSSELGLWGPAGSPTEPGLPHQLGLFPKTGRLLKSESEDSGVEMAGNENSPSTPLGSESSFSLDCLDGFQPSTADSAASDPEEGCPEAEGPEEPDPLREQVYLQNLSVSKKLAQVMQRSRKLHVPSRSPKPLGRKSLSLVELELLASYGSQGLSGKVGAAEGHSQALSGCRSLEEQSTESCGEEAEVRRDPSLTLPGQGLRYLEHVCLMLEKIAQLQRANLQLQQQQKVMESRLWGQQAENVVPSEERPCRAPEEQGLSQPEPENRAEVEMQEEDLPLDSWRPHHFRARSASDTGMLQDLTRSSENEPACSRKPATHCVSSPTLLDQPDWGAHTLPPNMRPRNDRSHWGKVKVLINRITRKSIRASEPSLFGESAVDSRQCSLEASREKQCSHPRRSFLPALGVKKHRSKTLSVR
ncbi:uncharacterized protein C8orf58 homolog isoform X1 [Malaclemys terrapin pileata]|uniref:uncharacterized protein C8orf58 homolog isoform X1 n=1 Tax=Malaclemys terrapin pileata TaxID=2991368 RepID=UPI0023A9104E|nr:uncharacterized protein C8orf58 homolog isoform X1 [Malaclemys terrapin pileata]